MVRRVVIPGRLLPLKTRLSCMRGPGVSCMGFQGNTDLGKRVNPRKMWAMLIMRTVGLAGFW